MPKAKLAFPKDPPRARTKAKRDRVEAARIKEVRAMCVDRDGYCRLWYFNDELRATIASLFGACRGPSEWSHFGDQKRFKTRGQAPEDRHTVDGSLMLCKWHHDEYDGNRMQIETLCQRHDAAIGTNGRLRFTRDGKIWDEIE